MTTTMRELNRHCRLGHGRFCLRSPDSHLSRLALQAALIAFMLTLSFWPTLARSQNDEAGDFDYLALSLSWSPTYCASPDGRNDRDQCSPGRRYAFVVHGLWPQYDNGWPEFCETRKRYLPQETIDGMLDIMPSKRLVIHEWRKHGTCFGDQDSYFDTTRLLFSDVHIPARYLAPQAPIVVTPDQLVADFIKTNRKLTAGMISVQCGNARDRGALRELRICFDRNLKPTACGRNERRSCRARELLLPPVR